MVLKWFSRIMTTILIVVLVGMLATMVSSKINGGAPKIFGKEILSVLSGSMEPGIKTGSIIVVDPINDPLNEHFQKGDVITFKSVDNANMMITHRIVQIKGSGNTLQFVTKGDNNDATDPSPVPVRNVVAKYANLTIPLLGYILSWIKTKAGVAILLLIPGLYLIVSSLVGLYRGLSKEDVVKVESDEPITSSDSPALPETTTTNG